VKPKRVTRALLRGWPLPGLAAVDSKEDRGRVLVIGGSVRIPGAALLAATASLRAGAGKLQVATSRAAALALALALPEAKVSPLDADANGEIARLSRDVADDAARADAVLVGPGMDPSPATRRVAAGVLRRAKTVVLDAGAIGAFDAARTGALILTPHHGEMAGMLGIEEHEIAAAPFELARTFARESGLTVVLKSADTVIANADGDAWLHVGGCVGLGTSGSGDVLAGVIAGLLATGAAPDQAAVWGVALHARAGEVLTREVGITGFLAREIAGRIPGVKAALQA
jgi:ADP-dependent NAD(P)H-hydrate dehydratase